MRIGLQVPFFSWPDGPEHLGEQFGAIAERAEESGFDSLWVMDHFFQIFGQAEQDMLEGYTALGFAAAHTKTIKLGTMVTGITYRPPGVLVKAVTTLDVLSGGRAYFGLGAAWFEREHTGLGVPFPPVKERFERLEETLRIAHQMWSENNGRFDGTHYQLAETMCVPQPLTKPHPPILIGGRGEKKTLRFVARYADATNISVGFEETGFAELKHKLAVLREHCERERRPYDAIEKTTLHTLWMTTEPHGDRWLEPDQAIERLGQLREMGVDHAIFNIPNVERPETLQMLAETIIPAAKKL